MLPKSILSSPTSNVQDIQDVPVNAGNHPKEEMPTENITGSMQSQKPAPGWTKGLIKKLGSSEHSKKTITQTQDTQAAASLPAKEGSFQAATIIGLIDPPRLKGYSPIDLTQSQGASPLAAGLRIGKVTDAQMVALRKDIETMLDLKEKMKQEMASSGTSKKAWSLSRKAKGPSTENFYTKNSEFQKVYASLFKKCDFKNDAIEICLNDLKNNLFATEKRNVTSSAPQKIDSPETIEALRLDREAHQAKAALLATLIKSIEAIPREEYEEVRYEEHKPESLDFAQQTGEIEELSNVGTSKKEFFTGKSLYETYGRKIENAAGGDCLHRAVRGKDLTLHEIIKVRASLADTYLASLNAQGSMDEVSSLNAMHIAAALSQSGIFKNEQELKDLMRGRDKVPNRVMADLMRIPGIYAGEPELKLFTLLDQDPYDIKGKAIAVISTRKDERLRVFKDGMEVITMQSETVDEPLNEVMDELIHQSNILLFKQDNHWTRIKKHDDF